jgi:hypothetical protein
MYGKCLFRDFLRRENKVTPVLENQSLATLVELRFLGSLGLPVRLHAKLRDVDETRRDSGLAIAIATSAHR